MRRFGITAVAVAIGVGVAAAPAGARISSFHTPSGNIGCVGINDRGTPINLRCDIAKKSWEGRHPASCRDLESGDSLTMGSRSRVGWTCHGDTALHSGPSLRYGKKWRLGPFRCVSRSTGLTWRSVRSGHGWFLSRASYRIF